MVYLYPLQNMLRSHTCSELNLTHKGQSVMLCGWVQISRDLGGMTFVDLRDRYGITQVVFNLETNKELCLEARKLGREFVVKINGMVAERINKNPKIPTGDIEVIAETLQILNASKVPPFTIEDNTDGGEELRMKYRYLDLRRPSLKNNLLQRHKTGAAVRAYLDKMGFADIETPFLIKSTPEGARDFVVPSRMNEGQFYALPQSPQTFKQLLMVSGFDRYYQIVRCFRDENLRADRQPEFTQIDCEMSFVDSQDIMDTFEGMVRHVFDETKGISLGKFPAMEYAHAIRDYGTDKPDIRYGMKFIHLDQKVKGKNFQVFETAEKVAGILAEGCANYTRKDLDALTDFVKRPQIGASGLVYIKFHEDGTIKSSIDKFFTAEELSRLGNESGAKPGDLFLILAGKEQKTLSALGDLRIEMAKRLGLQKDDLYAPLWVINFPLLEFNEEDGRFYAMHHPFTSPLKEDEADLFEGKNLGKLRANAYDLVINGIEIGGGSIRIHSKPLQQAMFKALGLSNEDAQQKFGFILDAFEYGAPPHGGIAFGFDRFCSVVIRNDPSIREFIAFPKNNAGRDMMLDAPSGIDETLKKELGLS